MTGAQAGTATEPGQSVSNGDTAAAGVAGATGGSGSGGAGAGAWTTGVCSSMVGAGCATAGGSTSTGGSTAAGGATGSGGGIRTPNFAPPGAAGAPGAARPRPPAG